MVSTIRMTWFGPRWEFWASSL